MNSTREWDDAVGRLACRHPEAIYVRLLVVAEQILRDAFDTCAKIYSTTTNMNESPAAGILG